MGSNSLGFDEAAPFLGSQLTAILNEVPVRETNRIMEDFIQAYEVLISARLKMVKCVEDSHFTDEETEVRKFLTEPELQYIEVIFPTTRFCFRKVNNGAAVEMACMCYSPIQ